MAKLQTGGLAIVQEICHSLLENGAQADTKNNQGNTPLYVAAERGNIGVMEALLSSRRSLLGSDSSSHPILYAAISSGKKEALLSVKGVLTEKEFDTQVTLLDQEFRERMMRILSNP